MFFKYRIFVIRSLNNILKQFPYFLFGLLGFFFPILNYNHLSILILIYSLGNLTFFLLKGKLHELILILKSNSLMIISNIAFYLLLILTLFYSHDIQKGLNELSKLLSVILVLFSLMLNSKSILPNKLNLILRLFVISNLIVFFQISFYIFLNSNEDSILNLDLRNNLMVNNYRDWHPGYISLLFLMSVFICMEHVLKKINSKKTKFFFSLSCVLFIVGILVLNSRMPIYSLIFLTIVYCFLNYKIIKKQSWFVVILILCLGLLVVLLYTNNSFYYRVGLQFEYLKDLILHGKVENYEVLDSRYKINKCSIYLYQINPFFGYGVGDVQNVLMYAYEKFNFFDLYDKKFNTHNQYLFFILAGGPILLLSFVYMIYFNLRISLKNKDILYFIFLLIFTIQCLTENVFGRILGVTFFTFFNSFFLLQNVFIDDLKK